MLNHSRTRCTLTVLIAAVALASAACGDDATSRSDTTTAADTSTPSTQPSTSVPDTGSPASTDVTTTAPGVALPPVFDFGTPTPDPGLRFSFPDNANLVRSLEIVGPSDGLQWVESWRTPDGNLLRVSTLPAEPTETPGAPPPVPFEIGSWTAVWHDAGGGTDEYLELSHGDYLVLLSASGEARGAIEAAAASLQPATDRQGWTIALDGYELVAAGLNRQQIVSDVIQLSDEEIPAFEVRVVLDAAGLMSKPIWDPRDMQLISVGDAPAALTVDSAYSTLTWEIQPGVFVILLGRSVTPDQLLDKADQLVTIDDTTYQQLRTLNGDGCGVVDC